jgi:Family of unknown function (DUF5691)
VQLTNFEELLVCDSAWSNALIFILKDHHEEIFNEFFNHFPINIARLPDWIMPDLLNFGLQHQSLQPQIAKLLSKRGIWLSKFKIEWAYINNFFVDINDSQLFDYGEEQNRLGWLRQLRESRPAEAFELLKNQLHQEKIEIKAKFLSILSINLQPEEEYFIFHFISDKRKELREAAFGVLENLPAGKLQKTCLDLAKIWLKYDAENAILKIEISEKHDSSLSQANIKANLHQIEGGEKASWLFQLVSKLNPDYWAEIVDISVTEWLQLFLKSDWKRCFLSGIWVAAQHFKSQNWLVEIHKLYLQSATETYWRSYPQEKLPDGLDNQHFAKIALLYLEDAKKSFSDTHPLINLLSNAPHWDENVSKEILTIIDNYSSKDNFSLYYGLKALLQRAAYAVDAQIYPFARELWEQTSENKAYNWIKDFRQFLSILQIRHFLSIQ